MKRFIQLILVLCGSLAGFNALLAYSANQNRTSQEFREQFVRSFPRISLNTTVGDAMMLRILVESSNAKRGIEVGSATGFGAINMAIAFETGGHLYTLEMDPKMVKKCRENVQKVGLQNIVTCIEGDARETLAQLEGQFDFAFLNAQKRIILNISN